ncbi:MAG: hypothetical protein Q7S92_03470 [Candidatus Diapherotrites archaeon]|nr:hypothetical protein [Candidatus Diapherotrites archaeon]
MLTQIPTNKLETEIRFLRKGLSVEKNKSKKLRLGIATTKKKTAKTARTVAVKTANLSNEMIRLKVHLLKLSKKKTSKKQLSEYNLFMRRQLNAGRTFNQAVNLWKAYSKGLPLVRTRTRVIRKTVVSKPRIVTKIRTVIRKVPVTVIRTIVRKAPVEKIQTIVPEFNKQEFLNDLRIIFSEFGPSLDLGLQNLKNAMVEKSADEVIQIQELKKLVYDTVSDQTIQVGELKKLMLNIQINRIENTDHFFKSDERISLDLLTVYLQEVHRLGLKRNLELTDVISAYFETLSTIKQRKLSG